MKLFLVALLFIGNLALAGSGQSTAEVFKKASPATVLIKTDSGGGSGFLVSSSGLVLTALHVVDGAKRVAIKTGSGDIYDKVILVAEDSRKDIAILKIPGFNLPFVDLGNSDRLSPGVQLVVVGNPLATEQLQSSVSDGILSGVRDLGDGFKVLQFTAPTSPGNSGGGVFTFDGKAIGIVSFRLVKGESLNFAIPINYARGLLESADASKPIATFDGGGAKGDLFSNKPTRNISGTWKANDGQVLQIKDKGGPVVILNLTYPTTNTDAQWVGETVVGVIYNGGFMGKNKWFVMRQADSGRLLFWFFDHKSKGSADELQKRIDEKTKRNPDYVLVNID